MAAFAALAALAIGVPMTLAWAPTMGADVPTPQTAPDSIVVYGPKVFGPGPSGGTALHVEELDLTLQPGAEFTLVVENGTAGAEKLDSATLVLNGDTLMAGAFGTPDTRIFASPGVAESNILQFETTGGADTHATVTLWQSVVSGYVVYGPQEFVRSGGQPPGVEFSAAGAAPPHQIFVENGYPDSTGLVTAGTVTLNGVDIFVQNDFSSTTYELSDTVTLLADNDLDVSLAPNNTRFAVYFTAQDTTKPVLSLTSPADSTVVADSSVTVGGTVSDLTSVQVESGGVFLAVDTAGAFSGGVPLAAEGANNVVLTATDAAGNSTTDSVLVIRDTEAPELTITEPADGSGTGTSPVTVSGTATDPSGVTVTINGVEATVDGMGAFTDSVALQAGANTITVIATDDPGNQVVDVRTVHLDTDDPLLTVTDPADGLVTSDDSVLVAGSVVDVSPVTVDVNGIPFPLDPNDDFAGPFGLSHGLNLLTITALDAAGNDVSVQRFVTQDTLPPDLMVSTPPDELITIDDSVVVSGTVTDSTALVLTIDGDTVVVQQDDSFSQVAYLLIGENTITVQATDEVGLQTTVPLTVTRESSEELPPDPSTVAPTLATDAITPLADATSFLYMGPDSIQVGVAPGTIELTRAAVVRGRVLNRQGNPLHGVQVTINDHPEYGYTTSRADGRYDMAVNGGSELVVNFDRDGHLPAQRRVDVPLQDWTHVEDVVLTTVDPQVTVVRPDTATQILVAQGDTATDADGSRQATVLFRPGTEGVMVMPDSSLDSLTTLSVRASEYTVGEVGPDAMPGPLPPTSAYTYAVELSVDEAIAAGATSVEFSQPVVVYLDNFLDFPVGLDVPVAGWDRGSAAWEPQPNGRIVEIVAINGGVADIDIDGDAVADDSTALAGLGIDPAERGKLAEIYSAGSELWRAETTHFSPLDLNWAWGLVADMVAPLLEWINELFPPCSTSGSIIECETQVLGERFGVPGTEFSLNYRSNRVSGHDAGRSLDIPLSGDSVPESLQRIEVEVEVAGQKTTVSFPADTNQTYTFEWDGLDAFGRPVIGGQTARVRVGYVYPFLYAVPAATAEAFGLNCYGSTGETWSEACVIPASINTQARQEQTVWSTKTARLSGWNSRAAFLGGWTLDVHHYFDPVDQVLYRGDGGRRPALDEGHRITTVAGTGSPYTPAYEDSAATKVGLYSPTDVAAAPDGGFYEVEGYRSIVRYVSPAGIINTVAGTGNQGYSGDGGPATEAQLYHPNGVAVGPDGSLYITDSQNQRIRRVSPEGIITTYAGTGTGGYSGDGGPATEAEINNPRSPVVTSDGSLYFNAGYGRVRRVSPSGIITTVAGKGGCNGYSGEGGAAVEACLDALRDVAVSDDGVLYITAGYQVFRVDQGGIITTFAGTGWPPGFSGDGGPATQARLARPQALAVGDDGSVYVSDVNSGVQRVRRIDPLGIINTVAGGGSVGEGCTGVNTVNDGCYGVQGVLSGPFGIDLDADGNLLIADNNHARVREVAIAFPSLTGANISIPSEDGSELYEFDSVGRHLRTLHALTHATLYSFGYDSAGRLITVTDADGLVTTIQRDQDGVPQLIRGPFGQETQLTLDANGYLASLVDPASDSIVVTHDAGGLLTAVRDPRGDVKSYTFDALGRLDQASDPAGGSKTLVRTESGTELEVEVTTGLGRTTTYRVEPQSTGERRRTVTDPAGQATVSVEGEDGVTTVAAPDSTQVTVSRSPDPLFELLAPLVGTEVELPSGLTMTTRQSRAVTLTTPEDLSTLQTWTDSSFVNGRAFVTDFDAATSTVTSTSAKGRVTTAVIDSVGRVLTQVVPGIDTVFFGYDSIGRLETVSQGGDSWSYDYDPSGRLRSLTDPLSRTDSLLYDSADRLVRQVLADSLEITYDYDEAGNLTSLTPPGRPAHTFAYDVLGLDSIYDPPDVTGLGEDRTFYSYDLDQQLTEVLRPDARSIALAYDSAGRLDAVTIERGTLDVAYDAVTGQVSSVTAPGSEGLSFGYDGMLPTSETWSGTVSGTVGFGYDTDFRVAGVAVDSDTVAYGYDDDGYLTQAGALVLERDSLNGRLTGTELDSVTTRQTFDAVGELAADSAWVGQTLVFARTYERDELGRITEVVDYADGSTTVWGYGYDPFGRLETVTQDSTAYASYAYDTNGNRLSRTSGAGTEVGTYDAQDRMSTYDGASYTYTAAGELAEQVEGADTTRYGYDELGNLTDVELPDGTLIEYVIDGRNRRIGRKVDGSLVQAFLYGDQLNPVAELDSLGNVVSRFVYGSRPNVPDYVVQGSDTLRVISDHLGSVRLVVNAATGSVVQKISYDAWGRVLADTNAGLQPFGFAGGIWDGATGLVRFGARDYSPAEGRWTAKEPLGFEGGDTQLYSYAFADPVGWVDVNGQNPIQILIGAAWGAAGGAVGGAGLSIAMQMALNGCVDWGQVGWDAAIGAILGGFLGGVGAARAASRLNGSWVSVSESMSARAAAYQARFGRAGQAFRVNGVSFDGIANGVLLEAKGPGYASFVRNGTFQPWFRGADALVSQAQRQIAAAGGAAIEWHFAEQAAAMATQSLFRRLGITGIRIVFTP